MIRAYIIVLTVMLLSSTCEALTNWIQQTKFAASDGGGSDYHGFRVALSGDYLLSSALQDDDNGSQAGAAWMFRRTGTNWTEQLKLTASDAAASDWFGINLALEGNTAVIAARRDDSSRGAVYVFVTTNGWTNALVMRLISMARPSS